MTKAYSLACVLAVSACGPTSVPHEHAPDAISADSSVDVVLPTALGGGHVATQLATAAKPLHLHHYGVELSTASPDAPNAPPVVRSDNTSSSLPASVDISGGVPPVGDQGQTGSCQAWATGYVAMGWWANRVGVTNAQLAPMYLYAQYAKGNPEIGAWPETPLSILKKQGIDTVTDYEPMQQNLDCTTQPSAAQKTNAAHFKISGYVKNSLTNGVQDAIMSTLAAGYPITLSISVYSEFENANASNLLVGPPQAGDVAYGGHAITAFAYDSAGVWIMNQWGTSWGYNGWAELSWDFIDGSFNGQANVADLDTITGVDVACGNQNDQCAIWAATEQCQVNPNYMLTDCCASCANPDPCVDTNPSCAAWAADNQCNVNPDYMQPYCCASCFGR
jgi:hypothetical protein